MFIVSEQRSFTYLLATSNSRWYQLCFWVFCLQLLCLLFYSLWRQNTSTFLPHLVFSSVSILICYLTFPLMERFLMSPLRFLFFSFSSSMFCFFLPFPLFYHFHIETNMASCKLRAWKSQTESWLKIHNTKYKKKKMLVTIGTVYVECGVSLCQSATIDRFLF